MSDKSAVFSFIDKSEKAVIELESLLTAIPAIAPESGGVAKWRRQRSC
jgi:hypothetical protein